VFFFGQRGGTVLLRLRILILPRRTTTTLIRIPLFLLLGVTLLLSQKAKQEDDPLPKYDHETEMKTKGVVDEVNLLTVGSRKDFVELIIIGKSSGKSDEDKLHIYLCPKPFQEEMGVSLSKGDELAITGSKVKLEGADVILAREVVKGTDSLVLRDDKGKPVWDWRTGK
jgi:hypothetical protein